VKMVRMEFIETTIFTRLALDLRADEDYGRLQMSDSPSTIYQAR